MENISIPNNQSQASISDMAMIHAVQLLSSWCNNNTCSLSELSDELIAIHSQIIKMMSLSETENKSINRTVYPDYIICLEDGLRLKTLKRHLSSKYGMTLEEYKKKWNLGHYYPTIAPNYKQKRSEIARQIIKTKQAA